MLLQIKKINRHAGEHKSIRAAIDLRYKCEEFEHTSLYLTAYKVTLKMLAYGVH